MSAISCAAIIVGSLIVLGALELPACAWIIGRLKRRARSYVDWTLSQPDVPESDETWLDAWPADTPIEVIEQAVRDRLAFDEVVRGEFPERKRFAS